MNETDRKNPVYWKTEKADKAAVLIDCADYYRALYETLCRAKHSIFILGWDIDGRIELLRGAEAKDKNIPVRLFDLIRWKAEENPNLKVYLNRWNYSIFFTKEREHFSGWKWAFRTPPNVRYCADYKIPFGACHHQKVIVIDGSIAFCGGMDIALGRWDHRQHHIEVRDRTDPGGFLNFFRKKPYEPYHDIQFMVSGPVVHGLADLFENRWQKAAGYKAHMPDHSRNDGLWPDHVIPDFYDIDVGIARTVPKSGDNDTVREILDAYIDEIGRAEKFIYIENQYLTCQAIARAINTRLKERPGLTVLAVSCDHPRGFMEHKAMWTGRVKFCDLLGDGVSPARWAVTYPVCKENGTEKTIHIHSKIMIVDDVFFHVGSSNLNNRSMGFDTECDLILEGKREEVRKKIASVRNNLIREHTGYQEKDIAEMIDNAALDQLLEYQNYSRQHLKTIDNEPYRKEILRTLAQKIGDPLEAHFNFNLPVRQILLFCVFSLLAALLFWLYLRPVLPEEFRAIFTQENFTDFIQAARNSIWSPFIIIGIYLLAGTLFFSVMALNLATAIVFGPLYGFLYAYLGSLSSAAAAYALGRGAGRMLSGWFRPAREKIKTFSNRGGIIGLTMVRMAPIAPFTAVNIAFGMAHVDFGAYFLATFLGLLPGITAKALFGGALGELFANPEPKVIFYVAGALTLWGAIIWASHHFFNRYKQKEVYE